MQTLSSIQLIELWKPDSATSAHWRLEPMVVATAEPGDDVGDDTLGHRNQRLLQIYQSLTTRPMAARSRCTTCETDNEFDVPVAGILACQTPSPGQTVELRSGSKRLHFRLPNMRDLRLAIGLAGEQASQALALSILISGDAADLNSKLIARLDAKLDAMDPAARILLDLACASCGSKLRILVDVAEIVSATLEGLVEKTVREVHVLASAYGWSERAILEMPESRRRRYLALATTGAPQVSPVRVIRA